MSFEISIWSVGERIGRREAIAIDREIRESEDTVPRGLLASSSIQEFRQELERVYPFDMTASCPWASDFSQSRAHLTLFSVFSRSTELIQFVLPLAHRHGLSVFDDRTQLIYLPPALVELSDCTLESAYLLVPISAYLEMVSDIIALLPGRPDPYLIVARSDFHYMQTYWTEAGFILEYRDGSEQAHFRALRQLSSDSVVRILHQYLQDRGWRSTTTFERVDLKC